MNASPVERIVRSVDQLFSVLYAMKATPRLLLILVLEGEGEQTLNKLVRFQAVHLSIAVAAQPRVSVIGVKMDIGSAARNPSLARSALIFAKLAPIQILAVLVKMAISKKIH